MQHGACKDWKDAASCLSELCQLAHHVFRMFCVNAVCELHVCWVGLCVCVCVCVSTDLRILRAICT
jgi:hypothetical protein